MISRTSVFTDLSPCVIQYIIRECVVVSAWTPLSVIETPSGKIRLVPRLEYGSKLEIISLLFQNGFTKKGQGRQRDHFPGLPITLRHLDENTSLAFYNLPNRNWEFLDGHVSQCSIYHQINFVCYNPQCPFMSTPYFFLKVDLAIPWR